MQLVADQGGKAGAQGEARELVCGACHLGLLEQHRVAHADVVQVVGLELRGQEPLLEREQALGAAVRARPRSERPCASRKLRQV